MLVLKSSNVIAHNFLPSSIPQGSYTRPRSESSSQSPCLNMASKLTGLQVELSETCALCLSRLMCLFTLPADREPQGADPASAGQLPSYSSSSSSPYSTPPPLLFSMECGLEDVNVFTLSNLAGKSVEML